MPEDGKEKEASELKELERWPNETRFFHKMPLQRLKCPKEGQNLMNLIDYLRISLDTKSGIFWRPVTCAWCGAHVLQRFWCLWSEPQKQATQWNFCPANPEWKSPCASSTEKMLFFFLSFYILHRFFRLNRIGICHIRIHHGVCINEMYPPISIVCIQTRTSSCAKNRPLCRFACAGHAFGPGCVG